MTGTFRTILTGIIVSITLAGCASVGTQPDIEKLDYKSRATTRSNGAVLVSASAFSADESRDVYGVHLAKKGIQPVWIQVENHEDVAYWLMSPGIDPNFFPASEAVEAFTSDFDNEARIELEQHFKSLALVTRFPPVARLPVSFWLISTKV